MCVFSSQKKKASGKSVLSIGDSPSDQSETCTTLCSVSRGLHLFSASSCPTRTNRGHTGGDKHRDFCAEVAIHHLLLSISPMVSIKLVLRSRGTRPQKTPRPLHMANARWRLPEVIVRTLVLDGSPLWAMRSKTRVLQTSAIIYKRK